jgi:hypothetical protein
VDCSSSVFSLVDEVRRRGFGVIAFFNLRPVCFVSLCVSGESWGSPVGGRVVQDGVGVRGLRKVVFCLELGEIFLRRLVGFVW